MTTTNRIRRQGGKNNPARQTKSSPAEVKILRLRECPVDSAVLDNPVAVEGFWRQHIQTADNFDGERESLWVFLLDTRAQLLSFQQLSQGTKDTILVNIAEVFRLAAAQNAARLIIAHNHPSGDPSPSDADIKVTRALVKAAAIMQIELVDHVIIGDARRDKSYASLRALGYFDPEPSGAQPESLQSKIQDLAEELNQVVARSEALRQSSNSVQEMQIPDDAKKTFAFGMGLLIDDVAARMKKVSEAIMEAAYGEKAEVAA